MTVDLLQLGQTRPGLDGVEVVEKVDVDVVAVRAAATASSVPCLGGSRGGLQALATVGAQYVSR